tara:strand:- start:19474 stop:19905 length:432 start_codon:yes stop_codon:yes gene_type:complete
MNINYKVKDLKTFNLKDGNLFKGLSKLDKNYIQFGEIYFTYILRNKIKCWKQHKKMTLNLIVLLGKVKFVIAKNKSRDLEKLEFDEIILSENKKQIITIYPGFWFGFQGIKYKKSLVTNIASILHSDKEVNKLAINQLQYKWK